MLCLIDLDPMKRLCNWPIKPSLKILSIKRKVDNTVKKVIEATKITPHEFAIVKKTISRISRLV